MILKTIQKLPVEKPEVTHLGNSLRPVGKKAKEEEKNGAKAVNAIRKCKLQDVGTEPINHLNSAAPAVKSELAFSCTIRFTGHNHRAHNQSVARHLRIQPISIP
jgi:hypothetical protein